MIWLLKPDHPKTTEFAPAMAESTGLLPNLPAVAGKPVHVAFDGGRLTSDAGILLLSAVEQRSDQPLLPHRESTKPNFVNGLIAFTQLLEAILRAA